MISGEWWMIVDEQRNEKWWNDGYCKMMITEATYNTKE
jgi:hypothetical protein